MSSSGFLDLYGSELVIGLVAPVGTDTSIIVNAIKDSLRAFGYSPTEIRLSDFLKDIKHGIRLYSKPEARRLKSYMDAGDAVRRQMSISAGEDRGDSLALFSAMEIQRLRALSSPVTEKKSYILRSLKHPDEVEVLRKIYGNGFFLIGVYSPEEQRLDNLIRNRNVPKKEAQKLIERDNNEVVPRNAGQQTRETFHLADAFVSLVNVDDAQSQIERIIDLIFGSPFITPSRDEYAMFQAFASALRSADLSRQVGAVILNEKGEFISVGANDVPRSGGGLYWPELDEQRDYVWGHDSNAKRRDQILFDIVNLVKNKTSKLKGKKDKDLFKEVKESLSNSILLDITEFGRPVHAEMEAILSCARIGCSPVNGTLYCTTFPCHNCAKHIVAAGIKKVVYVEPYPKSKAKELHNDSIEVDNEHHDTDKVNFVPFVGVGARPFMDLFSMGLSAGYPLLRKQKGICDRIEWTREKATLRVPMLRTAYLERETIARQEIKRLI